MEVISSEQNETEENILNYGFQKSVRHYST